MGSHPDFIAVTERTEMNLQIVPELDAINKNVQFSTFKLHKIMNNFISVSNNYI